MRTSHFIAALVLGIVIHGNSRSADEPRLLPEKAAKYHKLLLKRPQSGYLFDRFYNAWLDDAPATDLEAFLQQPNDGLLTNRVLLAFFYAKQGEESKALDAFRKVVAETKPTADVWYEKAMLESSLMNFEIALRDLAAARDANPDDATRIKIMQQEGTLLSRSGLTEQAVASWRQLLQRFPDDLTLLEDLIELQLKEQI
jgi:tetratricopeptide (TPR) repeat protein